MTHVILDGTLIESDRLAGVRENGNDLWFSQKHKTFGGNIQFLAAPDGTPLWVSDVEPGSTPDITAVQPGPAAPARVSWLRRPLQSEISQSEMCAELGASKPTVNRGFKELRECGLVWSLEDGLYQIHPLVTGGKVSSAVMAVPEIKAAEPERFTEQRRARYAAQMANLAPTG
ncbi:winged helix-turn-helix domain-containing protein [Streptomyces azureus]|nr:winged helix-turn-helix domain-containing protein [Streptomyces azureus]